MLEVEIKLRSACCHVLAYHPSYENVCVFDIVTTPSHDVLIFLCICVQKRYLLLRRETI